jgi:hypothetical protein
MSVKVELGELATTLADFDVAYLVTVSDEGRSHVLSVWAEPTDDGLVVDGVGRHTQANAIAHPDVTLVFPPLEPGGYTLLVDGRASVDETTVTITPAKAILHRAAVAPDAQTDAAPAFSRFAARPRSVWSKTILRRRTDRGVTSTHSSSAMNSSACSSDIGLGGISFSNESALDRTFVSFFSFVGLTSMSSARAFSPTIIPS